ncbi:MULTISPECIES: hypothetical protein [Moorena]|uniref:Uncharacterized protein n=1 Tax=Moorena producens 3L TaxID=489825 RepID=F4Y1I5_9CYAN|nr:MULTISPECIES: hypothetical protein [Moorena]EGJ29127.1 hypothetical protein LYNGBM3L_64160 [Moorena producens 3L]NEP69038.1 hypothetical protein [Moorena sp. SIO3A5]OLT64110.1 hypothetical protein BI334_02890 [Moorena producens 3L]
MKRYKILSLLGITAVSTITASQVLAMDTASWNLITEPDSTSNSLLEDVSFLEYTIFDNAASAREPGEEEPVPPSRETSRW